MGWIKALAGVACVSVVGVGIAHAAGGERITVDRVIDGDTVDVRIGDRTERIRLLNIDAPETKDPGQPVECLGPEASAFLSRRLPPGTVVELRYDIDRTDRYGRTLAAVFESGKLVNAEVARAGLASPVVFEPNRKFYPVVLEAAKLAQAARSGAYDPTIDCTLPSQIEAATGPAVAALAAVGEEDPTTVPAADLAFNALHPHLAPLTALVNSLRESGTEDHPSVASMYPESARKAMIADVEHVRQSVLSRLIELMDASAAIEAANQKAAERNAKALARKEAEATKKAEEAKKRAEAAKKRASAKAAAQRRAAAARAAKKRADKRRSSGKGSGGGHPGYTGKRCYAPGGKTWKPC